jgi:hypothetical protein
MIDLNIANLLTFILKKYVKKIFFNQNEALLSNFICKTMNFQVKWFNLKEISAI